MRQRLLLGALLVVAATLAVATAGFVRDMRRTERRLAGRSEVIASPFGAIEFSQGGSGPRGHRIWVPLVVDLLADRMTTDQILEQYPGLEADDVRACMAHAAGMTRERIVLTSRGVA